MTRAHRGAFNDTDAPALSAHVAKAAIERAGIDSARIDESLFGGGTQWGTQNGNVGRTTVFAAALPLSIPGATLDRKCGSELTALAYAARGIVADEIDVALVGGVKSITHTRNHHAPTHRAQPSVVLDQVPHAFMAMIETAEIVENPFLSRIADKRISLS